jgi:hypothetical protein
VVSENVSEIIYAYMAVLSGTTVTLSPFFIINGLRVTIG